MAEPRPNVLLLTIDAWRADFVDSFAGVALTPTLHQLLPRAVRFERAYANGPWTSPALVSLFTGENPARHGVHFEWSTPRPDGPALARRLQEAGYRAPNICYLNRVGNYANLGYAAAESPGYPNGPDDDLLLRTLAGLADGGGSEPWFLWYHYKYVHLPYWPAPQYRQLFGIDDAAVPARLRDSVGSRFVVPRTQFTLDAGDRELVQRMYAAGVRQMDDFLGRVLAELDRGRLLDRTVLVLTADHGEELLEHGHVGHASTSHLATLYEEVLRIPLVLFDGRVAKGRTVAERVQGLDLYPTILGLCGVSPAVGEPAGEGVDLSPLVRHPDRPPPERLGRPRLFLGQSSRMGYQTPRSHESQWICSLSDGVHKYVRESYGETRRLLFDLRCPPARLEQEPLADADALDAAERLLDRVLAGDPIPDGPLVAGREAA